MTQRSLTTYLDQKPPGYTIDSAYELAERFRLAEQTARTTLAACGFLLEEGRWVKQVTQLDRIEQALAALINWIQSAMAPPGAALKITTPYPEVVQGPRKEDRLWIQMTDQQTSTPPPAVEWEVRSENAQV